MGITQDSQHFKIFIPLIRLFLNKNIYGKLLYNQKQNYAIDFSVVKYRWKIENI